MTIDWFSIQYPGKLSMHKFSFEYATRVIVSSADMFTNANNTTSKHAI